MDIQTRPTNLRDHSGTKAQHRHERDDSKKSADDFSHIKGWGADLDPNNRPAYPMERTPPRLEGLHWHDVEDQPLRMKVYHSVERPGITPVFGTSTPPSGISGKIRDVAYGFSENDVRHWLLLLFADRVNVVEGIGQDLMGGRVPNVFAEMGINAEWRYNRAGLIRTAAVASAVIGVGYILLKRRNAHTYRF
ncbi:hypothetical protein [Noviherbaspirillum malthae]|jgi:hypothetical protein|uniref:hypothetical protein n=1 Tax=Noviherbaspirillum malthae TaxID=1260987 RepID=UPI001E2ADA69|nr:hypothetical protein [Noviherbaspirillum malthae]